MHIINRRGWELSDSAATPEHLVLGRRTLLAAVGAAGIALPGVARAQGAPRNGKYDPMREITPEGDATTYNNFYEFGTSKSISRAAQRLPVAPWTIEIDGLVTTPKTIGFDDLMRQVQLEERVYRHRCVEGWAMTVPWTGFPLRDFVRLADPTSAAKYAVFTTLADPKTMPGLRSSQFEWPYVEGVTMAEAMNELPFLATGMYGKTIPKQDGAPIRLVLP